MGRTRTYQGVDTEFKSPLELVMKTTCCEVHWGTGTDTARVLHDRSACEQWRQGSRQKVGDRQLNPVEVYRGHHAICLRCEEAKELSPCPSSGTWRYGQPGTAKQENQGHTDCDASSHACPSITSFPDALITLDPFCTQSEGPSPPEGQPWHSWTRPSWQTFPCHVRTCLQLAPRTAVKD